VVCAKFMDASKVVIMKVTTQCKLYRMTKPGNFSK
jgi:hypothetical protein